ncbi:protein-tyrosine phosphatase family protein [Humisphaera borealis]|uniref:Tyrosine specific protein phosphatases domain-containing protein n=1 Tax=Humisphaera borealis TaxID=2807512 RepID=A0A7M2WQL9_9BACT|nr:hypothetical protein [Humisphaera borealis]QOV87534.1 hypothetical protein IPV69_14680 [Humisphaera borealis]
MTQPLPSTRRFRVRRLAIAGVAVALSIVGWYVVRYHVWDEYLFPRNFKTVEEGKIYRSGQISSHLIRKTLEQHQIKVIVFMSRDDRRIPDVDAECKVSAELGIERHNFSLGGDGLGNPASYADALAVLTASEKVGKAALVHCNAGTQRTGGVVALYRTLIQGRTGEEAYIELTRAGHDPDDNPGLIPFLNQNMKQIAEMLVDRGVIERIPNPLPHIKS